MGNTIPAELLNTITTGDARLLAERIPDESIDLIFTDPVYDRIEDYRWLAETAVRVLKPNSAALVFYGIGYLPETLNAMIPILRYRWNIPHLTPGTSGYCDTGPSRYMGMLWLDNGPTSPKPMRYDVVFTNGVQDWHMWRKNIKGVSDWMESFTKPGDIVFDPFTGGGTVPAVCKMLGRQYVAFEIDPTTADNARQRVANTQPPLPIEIPQQGALNYD